MPIKTYQPTANIPALSDRMKLYLQIEQAVEASVFVELAFLALEKGFRELQKDHPMQDHYFRGLQALLTLKTSLEGFSERAERKAARP